MVTSASDNKTFGSRPVDAQQHRSVLTVASMCSLVCWSQSSSTSIFCGYGDGRKLAETCKRYRTKLDRAALACQQQQAAANKCMLSCPMLVSATTPSEEPTRVDAAVSLLHMS